MTTEEGRRHSYPADHWRELRRFAEGDELDPKGAFLLSTDTWDARAYSDSVLPSQAIKCRFRFSNMRSFLKLYLKRYCYSELIGRGELLNNNVTLPGSLSRADRYISEQGYQSLDDLARPHVFEAVWASLLMDHNQDDRQNGILARSVIKLQEHTRPFWADLCIHFGSPPYVPPVAPHKNKTPLEIGLDKSKLIPDAVLRQLINRLALHRDGITRLRSYDHLRLCVLLLLVCLGRRVDELLSAPRGEGEDGPLVRYPCRGRGGEVDEALWFIMRPNKGGPSEYVYISPEWESLATYCVRQLINYSDEVRQLAAAEEQHLLILVSKRNRTATTKSSAASGSHAGDDFDSTGESGDTQPLHDRHGKKITSELRYKSFCYWLNGRANSGHNRRSVLEIWGVTEDGSAEGPIYKFKTHYGRHTRQSAIAADQHVSLITRQRDLNHRDANMQFSYQHVVEEQNAAILSKVSKSPLPGQGDGWLHEAFGLSGGDEESVGPSKYRPGLVQLLTPRWVKLIEGNPQYFEPNRVPLGVCEEPDGPEGCLMTLDKKKVKAQNSSEGASSTGDSKAVRETVKVKKGRSPRHEKNNGPSVAKTGAQPAASTGPTVETEDLLRRLRERQKRVDENGGGEAK